MDRIKLTDDEARELIGLTKNTLINQIEFPTSGKTTEFIVQNSNTGKLFIISIYRGKRNKYKYNIVARIRIDNITLMELHINPTGVHSNPDGSKIQGNHWHIYSQQYGRKMAVKADKLDSEKFIDNTILLLRRFNVIEIPTIIAQIEF